jgi:small-conductance mechanosensitive channel
MAPQNDGQARKIIVRFLTWTILAVAAFLTHRAGFLTSVKLGGDMTLLELFGVIFSILAFCKLCALFTLLFFEWRGKPAVEGVMLGRIYTLGAILAIGISLFRGAGKLDAFLTFLGTFGGMLMGWSLQAPVSGFAAWVLVSVKRPFRPGDRVQFPNLGLTGDVKDIGVMYTVLDQVGGTIGSEEAVGRNILIPNAMLFSQVAINYTSTQEQAFILDEVVVRITFDSHWETAERILLEAATEMTQDIIENTGVKPYIRSDLYDYGVYLRLRYQTTVKGRAEMAYKISKRIFGEIQKTPTVDLAIPFVYSARAGARNAAEREKEDTDKEAEDIQEIEVGKIVAAHKLADKDVIEQLAQGIAAHGLLQPIVVIRNPQGNFDIVAGHLRFDACKRLGWKKIPAVIRGASVNEPAIVKR